MVFKNFMQIPFGIVYRCECVFEGAGAIDDPANVNYVITFDSSVYQ